jgi:hypothetical protein
MRTLEIFRADDEVHLADFCSQEHAAEWLHRPLPAVPVLLKADLSLRERVLGRVFFTFAGFTILCSAALMGLGSYPLVRLLGGWDRVTNRWLLAD